VLSTLARNAAGAEQSILSLRGTMDCFAEPVIGRAFARPSVAMAMAEKLPRRRSSLIFSIHPSQGQ
jgi:hypothetical protein